MDVTWAKDVRTAGVGGGGGRGREGPLPSADPTLSARNSLAILLPSAHSEVVDGSAGPERRSCKIVSSTLLATNQNFNQ